MHPCGYFTTTLLKQYCSPAHSNLPCIVNVFHINTFESLGHQASVFLIKLNPYCSVCNCRHQLFKEDFFVFGTFHKVFVTFFVFGIFS